VVADLQNGDGYDCGNRSQNPSPHF
jgi:hypothetical protein